ncbi:MAG: hypothetical protein VR67_15585 [Peptococcaceae bacterium BRH_c8a]|nr:MAG: hypothetical protein VR67_15585 [Peptococcaceae bacterium BRH_c8a]
MDFIGHQAFPGIPFFAFGGILMVLLGIVALLLVLAFLLNWLWNITIPQVFGLKEITYWQAFRLLIIAGLLFGGPVYFGN